MKRAPTSSVSRALGPLAQFALGQALAQVAALVSGLVIVRTLDPHVYGIYTFAFAFQTVIALIVDSGVTNSIVALVGQDADDPVVVSARIHAALRMRSRLLFPALACIPVPFALLAARLGADWKTLAYSLVIVEGGLLLQQGTLRSAALRIEGRISRYYIATNLGAAARLVVVVTLGISGHLSLFGALGAGLVGQAATVVDFRVSTRRTVSRRGSVDPAMLSETWRYMAPLMPGVIFYAFQGQISVLIGAIFGATSGVAEIGALGRIAQLVTFLAAANGLLLEPSFARNTHRRAIRVLGLATGCTAAGGLAVIAMLSLAPGATGLILGSNYTGLTRDLQLLLAAVFVQAVAGQIYTFNTARRFVHLWYTFLVIGATIAFEVVAVVLVDPRTTSGLVTITLVSGIGGLTAHLIALVAAHRRAQESLARC